MVWDKTKPENDMLLINFPASCRENWDALELGTDPALLITNDKISPAAGIEDTKLAQITTPNKVNGSALTGLSNIPSAAGVLPAVNSPGRLKADANDTTPEYMDSLIDPAAFEISALDQLSLRDGGVALRKLEGGSEAPGNSRYYGTGPSGAPGFYQMALSNLGDVNIAGPANGEALAYDSITGKWVNSVFSGLGAASKAVGYSDINTNSTSYIDMADMSLPLTGPGTYLFIFVASIKIPTSGGSYVKVALDIDGFTKIEQYYGEFSYGGENPVGNVCSVVFWQETLGDESLAKIRWRTNGSIAYQYASSRGTPRIFAFLKLS